MGNAALAAWRWFLPRDGVQSATLFDGTKLVDVTRFFKLHLECMGAIPPTDLRLLYGPHAVELEVRYTHLGLHYIAIFRNKIEFPYGRELGRIDLMTRLNAFPVKAVYITQKAVHVTEEPVDVVDVMDVVLSIAGPRGDFHGETDRAFVKARIAIEARVRVGGKLNTFNARGTEITFFAQSPEGPFRSDRRSGRPRSQSGSEEPPSSQTIHTSDVVE